MTGAEADEAKLLQQRMFQLQVTLGLGECDEIVEVLRIMKFRRDLDRGLDRRKFRHVGHRWLDSDWIALTGRGRRSDTLLRFTARTSVIATAPEIGRRRQIGGIGDPDQNHVGGGERPRRGTDLVIALQQHLPGAGEHRHRQPRGEPRGARPLRLALAEHRRPIPPQP